MNGKGSKTRTHSLDGASVYCEHNRFKDKCDLCMCVTAPNYYEIDNAPEEFTCCYCGKIEEYDRAWCFDDECGEVEKYWCEECEVKKI